MAQKNFLDFLMKPKNWWLPLLIIFTISFSGVFMIGLHTYTEAPPIPDFTNQEGNVVFMNIPAMSVLGVPTMVSTRDTGNYLY